MNKLKMTLREFINDKKITIAEFSRITNVSPFHLYKIVDDRYSNVTRDTMKKIYLGTQKKYEKGLLPHDYLSIID